ncbi:MAG: methyltransferase family protein [Fidelibacterota bacterium]
MSLTLKIIVFIILSGGLTWVSWPALLRVGSHGFYRFFAWEAIAALALTNLTFWFSNPFRIHQIISWFLLLLSILLAVHGFQLLRKVGKHDRNRSDPTLKTFEKTAELVTEGAYRYIRHPLYGSLLYLTWGVFFKHPSSVGAVMAVSATLFLTLTAKTEERENLRFFGTAYREYMQNTKLFIPFIY